MLRKQNIVYETERQSEKGQTDKKLIRDRNGGRARGHRTRGEIVRKWVKERSKEREKG